MLIVSGCASDSTPITPPPSVVDPPTTPPPATSASEEPAPTDAAATLEPRDITGPTARFFTKSCGLTVTVPDGFGSDGLMVVVSGDESAGSMGFYSRPPQPSATIESTARSTLEREVRTPGYAWSSDDGGQFLTIGRADAWMVTGTNTGNTGELAWTALMVILSPVCELTVHLHAPRDATETQRTLISIAHTIRTT